MQVTFLGQGFSPEADAPVGRYLMEFLTADDFDSFTGFSAFASEAGIAGLTKSFQEAKKKFKTLALVVGVDEHGTSFEALAAILGLGIEAFVFYQPAAPIFHPKIYLFEGEKRTELIIGSSNLTARGLFANVEASLLVSLDNENASDCRVVEDLKSYFSGVFDRTDPNLQPLTTELIEELTAQKLLLSENEREPVHEKQSAKSKEGVPTLIEKLFPKRLVSKIAKEFRRVKSKASLPMPTSPAVAPSALGQLVWVKRELPKSDVQIPAREGTNPTGGIRLTQAGFLLGGKPIDQTTYFRELFNQYKWKTASLSPFVETCIVPFEITILGNFIGRHNLEVRHKPSGEAGQHNYTTSISWGKTGTEIRDAALLGATLELYKPARQGEPFQIIFTIVRAEIENQS